MEALYISRIQCELILKFSPEDHQVQIDLKERQNNK